jgi:ubiquinone/menaquinone biosynthesis C-methylase UbiE
VTASAATVRGAEEPLEYLSEAVAAAAALRTAVRVGMLYQLDVAAATTQELAAACDVEARGAERLLHALAGLGLVELHGDRWRRLLPELSGLARLVALWDNLEIAVREGGPMVRADTVDGAASFYPDVVGNLGRMLAAAARRAAFLLPAATHVLDAGAGAAPWSIAYAIRHPSCVVTAVDLPAIVPATRQAVIEAGRGRQFDFVPGDLFEVDLSRDRYDLAIAGNICHLFDQAANRRLLSILYEALSPCGALAIADIAPDQGSVSRSAGLYELGLHLRTGSGGVHRLNAYREWLADATFEPPEIHELVDDLPLRLIIARKAGGSR